MKKVKCVTVLFKTGATLEEAIKHCKKIADLSGCIVYFSFNGVALYVDDHDIDIQFIVDTYNYIHYGELQK